MRSRLVDLRKERSERVLGSRIKKAREAAGLSQSDLAERTEINQGHISRLESGYFPRSNIHLIGRIAKVLGVTVDSLMSGKKEMVLSTDEKKILDFYRPLSKQKKKEVQNYLVFASK